MFELGAQVRDEMLDSRMAAIEANHCSTIIYTVSKEGVFWWGGVWFVCEV